MTMTMMTRTMTTKMKMKMMMMTMTMTMTMMTRTMLQPYAYTQDIVGTAHGAPAAVGEASHKFANKIHIQVLVLFFEAAGVGLPRERREGGDRRARHRAAPPAARQRGRPHRATLPAVPQAGARAGDGHRAHPAQLALLLHHRQHHHAQAALRGGEPRPHTEAPARRRETMKRPKLALAHSAPVRLVALRPEP